MLIGIISAVPSGILFATSLGEVGDMGDGLIVLVRWLHALGAVAWVGGSAFFALIVRPAQRADPDGVGRAISRFTGPYREMIDVSIVAIVVTGMILMFERLTGDDATVAYFIVLSVKIVIAGWMFYMVWSLRRAGFIPEARSGLTDRLSWLFGYNALLAGGVIVFLVAGLLRAIFETAISS
ncbi:MAG: hypothetical protein QF554_07495 [Dehalococcoidia bacterium]|nr:hypothetical protein [Dehalococcoidia bacterium]